MTIDQCKKLLVALERLATQRSMLEQINRQPAEMRMDTTLLDHQGTGIRASVKVPKGILQQSMINDIRRCEAEIRSYGVEPS